MAVTNDESAIPVHASWHALRIEVGPYVLEGELPTLPGYDPDRALARPNGEFVLVREPRLGRLGGALGLIGQEALVNRYSVERVEADIMLGFFFPGAAMPATSETDAIERRPAPTPEPAAEPDLRAVTPGSETSAP